jgi:hypothetical protein
LNVKYTNTVTDDAEYTVFGVPKDRSDDMSGGVGRPMRGAENVTYDEALNYADRNESPDNSERYVIRNRAGQEVRP